MANNRNISFDVLKGIGIVLVCIGHTPTVLTTWIYGFHMPLFIFISGYFYKHVSFKEIIKKGFKNNIKPYLIFCVISLVMLLIYLAIAHRPFTNLLDFVTPFDTTNYLLTRTIWFLPCLFLICISFSLIKRLFNSRLSLIICLLLYVIDCCLVYNQIHLPFFIDTAMGMIVFYAIGYEVKCSGMLDRKMFQSKPTLLFLALIILGIYTAMVIWLNPKTEWKYNIFDAYNLPIALTAILGCLFACRYLVQLQSKKILMLLGLIGGESLVIMGLHSHLYDLFIMPVMIRLGLPLNYMFIPMLVIAIPASIYMNFKLLRLTKSSKMVDKTDYTTLFKSTKIDVNI